MKVAAAKDKKKGKAAPADKKPAAASKKGGDEGIRSEGIESRCDQEE